MDFSFPPNFLSLFLLRAVMFIRCYLFIPRRILSVIVDVNEAFRAKYKSMRSPFIQMQICFLTKRTAIPKNTFYMSFINLYMSLLEWCPIALWVRLCPNEMTIPQSPQIKNYFAKLVCKSFLLFLRTIYTDAA